jgi:phage gp36-like protein
MYATLSDLTTFGLPATALGSVSTSDQQAFLEAASAEMDEFLGARYALPLLAWPVSFNQYCAVIAAYRLMVRRGYNPASGADPNFEKSFKWALDQLRLIQNQQLHPRVTPSADQSPTYDQPMLISSSVTSLDTGATAQNRGW